MHEGAGRIAGGVVLLIALWIGVYWWWPSGGKITFAQGDDAIRGVSPKQKAAPAPQAQPAPALPHAPAPQPDPAPTIIPPQFTQYVVQKGDTFASIAKHYYGSAEMASVIIAANPLMSPQNLSAGRTIQLPKDPNNIQGLVVKPPQPVMQPNPAAPTAPAEREYVVQSGDSLSKIAQEVYGDSRLASFIFEANHDQLASENAIKVGQKLRVPPRPQR